MLFREVVGQVTAKEGIIKMWHNNVLPHAIMISGAEGTGGLPIALALAQYIFCESKEGQDACGKCAGCSKASKLEHADLHLSFPTIKPKPDLKAMSKYFRAEFKEFVKQTPYGSTYDWLQHLEAENKQGNITAEECREIINDINLKSYEGGHKVLVMWRPEYLGKEGNILLKLIEEPPANTILIFVAEQIDEILPTILSRTQNIRLIPLKPAEIAEALITRANTDPVKAAQLSHLAGGSYTEALRLQRYAENDMFATVRQLFNGLFVRGGDGVALAKVVEETSKMGREQQKNLLLYVIHLLEHTLKSRYNPSLGKTLPETESQFVLKLSTTNVSFEGLSQIIHVINETHAFIEQNAHSKTQLHAMLIKMHYIIQNKNLPTI